MSPTPALTLFRGSSDAGCYSWSPFVTKAEFILRSQGVAHDLGVGSTLEGPKGKIPYINLVTDEGSYQVGDSTLIIKHLVELGTIPNMNAQLSASMKIQDLGVRALLEDRLYFYGMRERWLENYYPQRNMALASAPYLLRPLIGLYVYRRIVQTLYGQGTGRYTREEVADFKVEIWESLNEFLLSSQKASSKTSSTSREPFWVLGGTKPTQADASLYGFITSILVSDSAPDSLKIVRVLPALMDYAGRIHDRYFPDYVKCA